jgi:hypothetical protein
MTHILGTFTPLVHLPAPEAEVPDQQSRHNSEGSNSMPVHAVKMPVPACVSVECIFWPEQNGWKGACGELSISVGGATFEECRNNMEMALQTTSSPYFCYYREAA